ncbi:MAG TPA: ABC transporter permease [Anaerolineaceae bacterium]|nr:ABC transporter permease [Anaerolineaceae bacterium]
MNKTLQVFLYELKTTVMRKSFIITLLLIPLIGLIITLVLGNRSENSGVASVLSKLTETEETTTMVGLVDESDIIKNISEDYNSFIHIFSTQSEANLALENAQIKAFYVIPIDYIDNGDVIVYRPDFNPLSADEDNYMVEKILNKNLLADQNDLEALVIEYPNFEVELLSPEPQRDPRHQLTFFLPYIVTFLFYIVILSSASLMLNSVTNEKSNRVIEILLTSITPLQLLSGKITALGLTGLLQTVVWSGSGLIILRMSGNSLSLPPEFQLPTSILFWGIIFFVCGYALFASLMAGLGALVSNIREASQATTIIIIPLVIPLMLLAPIIEKPNGTLAIIFSLFPLTSPVTMMTRLSAGNVPVWQILLAILLLIISIFWVINSVSRFFQAQYLLSGKEFKLKYFLQAMVGRI